MASAAVLRRLEHSGQGTLPPGAALDTLRAVLIAPPTARGPLVVNPFDWARFLPSNPPPIFSEVAPFKMAVMEAGLAEPPRPAQDVDAEAAQQAVVVIVAHVLGKEVALHEPVVAAGTLRYIYCLIYWKQQI